MTNAVPPGGPPGWNREEALARLRAEAERRKLADEAFTAGLPAPAQPVDPTINPVVSNVTPLRTPEPEAAEAPERPHGADWLPVDLTELIDSMVAGSYVPERPLVGMLDGAEVGLFYAGRVSGIAGDSSSGKTWTALAVGAMEMTKGNAFVLIDLEDSAAGTLERLFDMGVDPEVLRSRFVYLSPETKVDLTAQGLVQMTIKERSPSLVVIDSTGEALAIDGSNPNADEEVALWMRKMPKLVARLGPAVLLLDHVTKASEGRGDPSGTQRKKSAITGAQYNQKAEEPFRRGQAGHAVITCTKDRRGYWANQQQVAELHLQPRADGTGVGDGGGAVSVTLRACVEGAGVLAATKGDGSQFRPTALMQRVSIVVENAPKPLTYTNIRDRVNGKREWVRIATDLLITEGHLIIEKGERGAQIHRSIRPYRESTDPQNGESPSPGSGSAPTSEPTRPSTWEQPGFD